MTSRINHLLSLSRPVVFFALLAILIFFPPVNNHAEVTKTNKRPQIGLVLSGGGARGLAHIGVLKVLEEMRIPIDCIAGTSMGAIVGGLYAAGASPAELEKLVTSIRKEDRQSDKIDLNLGIRDGHLIMSKGLVQGQNLNLLLKEILLHTSDTKDFDSLHIPFRAVAADIESGQAVVIGAGDLSQAIRASMSIPGIFAPMEIGGKMLVDGGIANNLPIDVVRGMGADILIVVDIGTPLRTREGLNSPGSITAQVMTILIQRNVQAQLQTLKPEDILIQPQLGNLGTTDFSKTAAAMHIGQDTAKKLTHRLTSLSVSPENYQVYLAHQRQQPVALPKIDYVKVEIKSQILPPDTRKPVAGKNANDINLELRAKLRGMAGIPAIGENRSKLSPQVLEAQIETKAGEQLDVETLKKDINRLYGLDTFERVDFHLEKKDGKTGLIFDPVEKSWGPTYLRFSLSLADDFKGVNSYTIGGRITRTEINALGAEWRNQLQIGDLPRLFSEFYQPLDFGTRYFIAPRIEYREWNANVYIPSTGNVIAEYRIKELAGGLDVGRQFGNWGEFRIGLVRGYGATRLNVGDPSLWSTESFNAGALTSSFAYNTLDDFNFPTRGADSGAKLIYSLPELGSDNRFTGIDISGLAAKTWGKTTIIPRAFYKGVVDGDGEIQNAYTIGGFLNLSGYRPEELSGKHVGLASIICYQNMGIVGLGDFHTALYVGFSAEAGGAWQDRSDITFSSLIYGGSVFVGATTYIGPAYLAYGIAEGGHQTVGLFIGQRF
jgi:NTE family protein